MNQKKHGFTLIELSIVLVIIGLVVGGVLAGQELIKSAQLKRLVSDVDGYNTAVRVFRSKYNCLPGDCDKATGFFGTNTDWDCNDFWGAPDPSVPRSETCNGNGNGHLNDIYFSDYNEQYFFWQHLAAAGLIAGQYSGYWGNPISSTFPTSTYLASAVWGVLQGRGENFVIDTAKAPLQILVIAQKSDANFHTGFSGRDLLALDSKYDDGMPATGALQSISSGYTTSACYTGAGATAQYATSVTTPICSPIFKLDF